MVEHDAQKQAYPTVAEVLAKRGNPQFTLRPGVLAEMAEICEEAGCCDDGIEWGMNNPIEDVPGHCPDSGWCVFMLIHFKGHMTADLRAFFVRGAIRDNPAFAAYLWRTDPTLTAQEYDLLDQRMRELPKVRRLLDRGRIIRADRQVRNARN